MSTTRPAIAGHPAADTEADQVDRIAAAVTGAPGVVALGGGGLLQPVTYLAGRRVTGVRLSPHCVEVAVVAEFGVPAPELARRIRAVLASVAPGRVVDVLIADVQLPVEAVDSDAYGETDGVTGKPDTPDGGVRRPSSPTTVL